MQVRKLSVRIGAVVRTVDAYPYSLPKGLPSGVEVDETYVGGKVRGMGQGYKGNKAIAIGAVQREGKIRLHVIAHADKVTPHKFVADNTAHWFLSSGSSRQSRFKTLT